MKKEKVITDRDILLHDGFGENISIVSFTPLTQRLGIYVATPCFLLTLQLESSKCLQSIVPEYKMNNSFNNISNNNTYIFFKSIHQIYQDRADQDYKAQVLIIW